jgi:hypothetical protein
LAILGDPGPEPFLDQAEDPSVGDPVLEELDQPSVVDGIERLSNMMPPSRTRISSILK